MITHF